MAEDEGMAYIGLAPCGCVRAVSVDDRDRATARRVSDMITEGLTVERVPIPVTQLGRCPHEARQEVMSI